MKIIDFKFIYFRSVAEQAENIQIANYFIEEYYNVIAFAS